MFEIERRLNIQYYWRQIPSIDVKKVNIGKTKNPNKKFFFPMKLHSKKYPVS
jgi:hypothetical protein